MLPTVGDFLKSTFGESLKKPLQPAGLFAAAIFVFLNILFVFPTLVDQNEPLAIAVRDMGGAPQAVLAGVVVLVLAYVLLSMGGSILKLMDGELWSDSPWVGARLIDAHCSTRRALKRAIWNKSDVDSADRRAERRQSLFRLNTDYPPAGARVAPTALGNVLYATVAYLWDRYRIDMTVLWPHMETVVAGETALAARLDNEKAALDFLLNLAFMLFAFATEYAALRFSLRQFPELVYSLGFLLVAWGVYRAAVSKARSWGAAVQLTFDLHRDKLRRALGMRPFSSEADERECWRRISRWLMWAEPPGNVLAFGSESAPPAPADAPVITTSANAAVTTARALVVERFDLDGVATGSAGRGAPAATATAAQWKRELDYVLLVANAPQAQERSSPARPPAAADGASVLVCDPRAVAVDAPVLDKQSRRDGWQFSRVPSGRGQSPDDLLWSIRNIPPHGSRVLRYQLATAALRIVAADGLHIARASHVEWLDGLLAFDLTLELQPRAAWIDLFAHEMHPSVSVRNDLALPQPVGRTLPGRLTSAHASGDLGVWTAADCAEMVALPHTWRLTAQQLCRLGLLGSQTPVQLRYHVLAAPTFELGDRLLAILSQLKVCHAIPSPLDAAELGLEPNACSAMRWQQLLQTWTRGWDALIASKAPENWARVVLEMDSLVKQPDVPEAPRKAPALNNLGCAWMWFCQWDRAEKAFRDALAPFVRDHQEDNSTWTEGDPRPRSAKEAADYNLDALSRARDAWMRGT